jgi:peptidoglycan/LPS O-acetylase OafA/YrhL
MPTVSTAVRPLDSMPVAARTTAAPLRYRPDIDGLRALAIASVVAFHAGIRGLQGGFVGVDIFFVVSGYLIGGIVYREAKEQTFSFATFYQRRAKRILPAFFAVLISCYIVALLLLSPRELQQFAATAFAAIFSASNIQIWLTTGYFTNGSQFNPLLMTWSLAVEEQFYALFPIALLLVVNRKPRLLPHAIAICSVLSFVLALWGVDSHPTAAFFLLPTRAWEIGLGALLAVQLAEGHALETKRRSLTIHTLAALGTAMLVVSILFSKSNQFPGIGALLPVVGTLLLLGTPSSFISRVLSIEPIVFVGKLSYSWYLWHWPMLSFAKIVSARSMDQRAALVIVAISFLLAIGSFYFVEKPFRNSRTPAPRMLARYGVSLLTISAVPLFLMTMKGLPHRQVELAEMEAQDAPITDDKCLAAYGKVSPRLTPECVSPTKANRVLALLGDSHAGMLAATLRRASTKNGYALDELAKASCPPLLGATIYMPNHAGHDRECAAFNLKTLDYVRSNPQVELVVIAGFWSGPSLQSEDGLSFVRTAGAHDTISMEVSRNNLKHGLESEVEELRASGKTVVLVKDAPVFTFNPVRYEIATFIPLRRTIGELLIPASLDRVQPASSDRAPPYDDSQETAIVDDIAAHISSVQVYDLRKRLCERDDCLFLNRGSLLYIDSNHLSELGADTALADFDFNSFRSARKKRIPNASDISESSAAVCTRANCLSESHESLRTN